MDLLPKRDLRHPLLRIEHLSKSFGAHEVLRDIDFTVYRGDVISVIGSSGSGKSTLLRCVNLLETPSSGEIRFHSSNILSPGINVPGYRAKVGMVFQSFNLFDNMSVLKNCEIGQRKVLSRGAEEAREKAMHYLRKVGMALLTIFAASLLTFCLLRAMPGDVFYNQARDLSRASGIPLADAYRQVTERYNYDPEEPLLSQMARYYGSLLQGNLGTSMINQSLTVNDMVAYALPWTLFITVLALSITFVLGISIGGIMVWHRKGFLNGFLTTFCTVTSSIPVFVWSFLLMILFVFQLHWFPINGAYDLSVSTPGFNIPFILDVLYHAALPVMTYVLTSMGLWALQMKSSGITIMGEDFINAAYARGLENKTIRKRYMMRNAMLPVITMLAITFSTMISTGAFVENSYAYPGMGRQLAIASGQRDFPVMQGFLLVMAVCTIVANLVTELLYMKLDPRIKAGG